MEWALAAIALTLIAFGVVSRRVEGTPITPAIIFVGVGLLVGPQALDLLDTSPTGESVKLLVEATPTLVLFADASRINMGTLRREYAVPARLLGIGLPLTIAFGTLLAAALFDVLSVPEALVLAALLAPTDAALGQAVVTEPRLPSRIRQGLNVESGLNDGICVPLLFIALAVAEADVGEVGAAHAVHLVVEEIGYGILGGIIAGAVAAAALTFAGARSWIERTWVQILPVAAAALAYGIAAPLDGSGFIAAFVAGMTFGALRRRSRRTARRRCSPTSSARSSTASRSWSSEPCCSGRRSTTSPGRSPSMRFASLTIVRIVPVALAMLGTGARRPTVGFLGWFGPRGLASIVFALIVVQEADLPHTTTIVTTTYVTVGLSVLLHGVTAAPLARRYAAWFDSHPPDARPAMEAGPGGRTPVAAQRGRRRRRTRGGNPAVSRAFWNSSGRTRTCNPPVNSRMLYH